MKRLRMTIQSGRQLSTVPLTLTGHRPEVGPPQGTGDKKGSLIRRREAVSRSASASRFGFTILEMIVAMLLLGTVMAIVVPVLGWMGIENRLSLQRQEATEALNNLMDELTSRPYAELTPEAAGKIELSDALKRQLPGGKLDVEITETEPKGKRIHLRLSWKHHNGRPLAPVRLTAWVHSREGRP